MNNRPSVLVCRCTPSDEVPKEGGCEDAAFFHTALKVEKLSYAALILHGYLHVFMELFDHVVQFWGTSDFQQDVEESFPADQVKLVRSMKVTYQGFCCSLHFSCSCQREIFMSLIECSAPKPIETRSRCD